MMRLITLLLAVGLCATGAGATLYSAAETRLGPFHRFRWAEDSTADGSHLAYAVDAGGPMQLVVDGQPRAVYPEIRWLTFSADGAHLAYTVKDGDGWQLMLDGQSRGSFHDVFDLVFSPDGSRLAHKAAVEGEWHDGGKERRRRGERAKEGWRDADHFRVDIDGESGPEYDEVGDLVFSADSRHVAYAAREGGSWRVVTDGQPGEPFTFVGSLAFQPGTDQLAYVARSGSSWMVMAGSQLVPCGYAVGNLTYSRDGMRTGYVGSLDAFHQFAVVDGQAGPVYDAVTAPVFGGDGAHVAYEARLGASWMVVEDGVAGPAYDAVGPPVFSLDGRRLAYATRQGTAYRLVTDGTPGVACDGIGVTAFSPDGSHLAYWAKRGSLWRVCVDDWVSDYYYAAAAGPAFLDDGSVECLAAEHGGGDLYRVVLKPRG
jgi:hypothetical protein